MIWTYLQISLSILRLCITYWSLTPLYTVCPHGTTTEKPNTLKINRVRFSIVFRFDINLWTNDFEIIVIGFKISWLVAYLLLKKTTCTFMPKIWCSPKKPVEVNNTRYVNKNLKKKFITCFLILFLLQSCYIGLISFRAWAGWFNHHYGMNTETNGRRGESSLQWNQHYILIIHRMLI